MEANVTKFKAAANRAGRRDRIGLGADAGLKREEVEEVFQEHRLFGDVIEARKDSFDVGARAVEGAGQKSEAAERNGAGESAGENDHVRTVIAARRE